MIFPTIWGKSGGLTVFQSTVNTLKGHGNQDTPSPLLHGPVLAQNNSPCPTLSTHSIKYLTEFSMLPNSYNWTDDRHRLVHKYAWAIPNMEAIDAIVHYSPIIEIGAGAGYWAYLIEQAGGKVSCYDKTPLGRAKENPYGHRHTFHHVYRGNESAIKQKRYQNHTLFLCWPPYNTPMAMSCLQNYKGEYLIYVGETNGGCNGDPSFWGAIQNEWEELKTVHIPQWEGIHDELVIYRRVSNMENTVKQCPECKKHRLQTVGNRTWCTDCGWSP